MELIVEGNTLPDTVTARLIDDSIRTLTGDGDSFAILARDEQVYIQTSGGPRDGFILEYRDGSEAEHYSCKNHQLSADQVIHAFQSYLADDGRWKTELQWESQVLAYSSEGSRSSWKLGAFVALAGTAIALYFVFA